MNVLLVAMLAGLALCLSCERRPERRIRVELPVNFCGLVTLVQDASASEWLPENGVYVLRVGKSGFSSQSFSNFDDVWFNAWRTIEIIDASGGRPALLSANDPPEAKGIGIGYNSIEGRLCP
jgi:hypothetical protein